MGETVFDPAAHGWKPMRGSPMPSGIGLPWARRQDDGWRYAMLADASHANPQGAVHGGVLMTFLDHALSIIAWEAAGRQPSVTVQLNGHFVDSVRPGEFIELQADIVRRTRSMVFMRGILLVGDRQVVAADGIWRVLR
jgi:uncharacterized protein (TIGR00369 family)